jgi:PAS domain S-box-containing protein
MVLSLVAMAMASLAAIPLALLLKERRRIRMELSEQQRIFENAFAASASGMALLDLEGHMLRVNRTLCEFLGYPEPELLGKSFRDVTYSDDLAESITQFQRLVTGEIRSYRLQTRYVHRNGYLSWALITNALVRDEKGQPRVCVAQIHEITESKREAEALANRERQFSKAQVLAKIASWEWNLVSDVLTWSEPVYQLFGLDPQAFEPTLASYLTFVHPEDRELIKASLEQAKHEHRPYFIDQRIVRADGEQRILHVQGEVEVGPHGQALRMYGTAQDVTENRQALDAVFREVEQFRVVSEVLRRRNVEIERQIAERDQELSARDLMFQRIVNHVPAAVSYFDRNLACQWMNPEALACFGITAAQLGHISAANFPLYGYFFEHLEAVRASGEPFHGSNLPVPGHQTDRERLTYWDLSLIPCLGPEGKAEGLLAFGREVTDRIEKERLQREQIKALEASEALKDHYLSTLSHEIRSPLTVILGTALLFQGEALGPLTDKQRVYIAKLLRNGRDLTRLVNNVLECNVLRSGRLELYPELLAMADLIREVKSEFHASVGLKGQQLIDEIEGELPMLLADRRRLLHVWLNLVANAVQYAPEGTPIIMRARMEADRLVCEVSNTGSRIPEDKLPALFSAVDHPGRGQKGLGLGLGLSKALVEAHGGTLAILNQEDGVTASFSLPVSVRVADPV